MAGLNLNRGWCMEGIAAALPAGDARRTLLEQSAKDHAEMGYKYVFSGHYEGDHWLATFAIFLHQGVAVNRE